MRKPAPVQHDPLKAAKASSSCQCQGTRMGVQARLILAASPALPSGPAMGTASQSSRVRRTPSIASEQRTTKHFSMSALQPVIPARLVPAEGGIHRTTRLPSSHRKRLSGLRMMGYLTASGRSGLCATPSRCGLRSPLLQPTGLALAGPTSGGSSSLRSPSWSM